MEIRTFDTFEEASAFAEKHGKEVMLFSLENGQQNFQWKPIGALFEPFDVLAWIQDERKNTIFENAEDFIDFSLEPYKEDLENGEITQDIFDKREQEVNEIVEEFKKFPDGFIVHEDGSGDAYVEPQRYVMRWYDDVHTTYAVGVEK